jgi:hypothetical protein
MKMDYYLDETFDPKTEIGKKLKQMVEDGEHCDGNIYWLIEQAERVKLLGYLAKSWNDQANYYKNALENISDILEGQNVTPLVESIAYVLVESGIYDKD